MVAGLYPVVVVDQSLLRDVGGVDPSTAVEREVNEVEVQGRRTVGLLLPKTRTRQRRTILRRFVNLDRRTLRTGRNRRQ